MERFLLKPFASNPTIPTGVYGSEAQGNAALSEDLETIQSGEAWEQGIGGATQEGIQQPALNDDQGVYKVLSQAIKNGQVSGVPLWYNKETYFKGSICLLIDNDGKPTLYYSKTDNNTGNNPATDTTNWGDYSDLIADKVATNYVKIDGSNATFDSLNDTAEYNILSSVLGGLQTEDNTKVGYVKFFNQISNTSITLPEGGSYWCSFFSTGGVNGTEFRTSLTIQGFFAGGTTFTSVQGSLTVTGWCLKIQ